MKNKKILSSLPDLPPNDSHSKILNRSWLQRAWAKILNIITQILIFLIVLLRPLLGPTKVCPFTIGCTEYAIMQLKTEGLWTAIHRIIQRLLACNPITNWFKTN